MKTVTLTLVTVTGGKSNSDTPKSEYINISRREKKQKTR
jgi:hypothetical protein